MTEQEATQTREAARAEDRESSEQELREALAKAEAAAEENRDKYLRAAAELDNVRKRAARDIEQARRSGVERSAGEILPVLDSLEMGVNAAAGASPDALLEGQQATLRLLRAALERLGVVEVAPDGQAFDPQLHEALSIQQAAGAEAGSVIAVVQKGYQLGGRLLRPARVIVADTSEDPAADGGASDP